MTASTGQKMTENLRENIEWIALGAGTSFILNLLAVGVYLDNHFGPNVDPIYYALLFVVLSIGSLNGHYLGKVVNDVDDFKAKASLTSFLVGIFSAISVLLVVFTVLAVANLLPGLSAPKFSSHILVLVFSGTTLFLIQASNLTDDVSAIGTLLWIFFGIVPFVVLLAWILLEYVFPAAKEVFPVF